MLLRRCWVAIVLVLGAWGCEGDIGASAVDAAFPTDGLGDTAWTDAAADVTTDTVPDVVATDETADGVDAPTETDAGTVLPPPDGDNPPDEECHTDCFGGMTCQGGVVYEHYAGTLPCNRSGWDCPMTAVYTCKQGCNPKPTFDGQTHEPIEYCNEAPKEPGDACATDADCQPFTVPAALANEPTPVSLSCDPTQLVCLSSAAPIVTDYQQGCGLNQSALVAKWPYGNDVAIQSTACSTGVCHVLFNKSGATYEGCFQQACTTACATDWDCPAGARCVHRTGFDVDRGKAMNDWMICIPAAEVEGGCPNWK